MVFFAIRLYLCVRYVCVHGVSDMKRDRIAFKIALALYYRSDYGKRNLTETEIDEMIQKIAGRDKRTSITYKNLLYDLGYVRIMEQGDFKVENPREPKTPTEIVAQEHREAEKRKQAKPEE